MMENIPDAECEAIQSKREILLVSPISDNDSDFLEVQGLGKGT